MCDACVTHVRRMCDRCATHVRRMTNDECMTYTYAWYVWYVHACKSDVNRMGMIRTFENFDESLSKSRHTTHRHPHQSPPVKQNTK